MLRGDETPDPDGEENWPLVRDTSEAAWRNLLDDLRLSQKNLRVAIEGMDADRLAEPAPGRFYPCYQMLYGIIHHLLYHAGQIALLKRALGPIPS